MLVNSTRMLRVKAVAEMFDVSVATIYRAIESGQLEALRVGSGKGSMRVPVDAVTAYRKLCAKAANDEQPADEVSTIRAVDASVSPSSGWPLCEDAMLRAGGPRMGKSGSLAAPSGGSVSLPSGGAE